MRDSLRGSVNMKDKWLLLTTALLVMILGVVVYCVWKANHRSGVWQLSLQVPEVTQVNQGSVIFSPQKDRGVAIVDKTGRPQLWLISVVDNRRSLVMQLETGEAGRNIRWSPDGHSFAFEAYDPGGHSPMTTTHVWVVNADGTVRKEVRLPAPNERLSTYLDGWIADDSLRIRCTLLEQPEDVFFVYRSATGRLEGPVKE
jgi:dipeptidyl aminopeptidase/acylaminoacyl peptidase